MAEKPKKRPTGGARPGAGRPKGSKSVRSIEIAKKLAEKMTLGEKVSPLEVMVEAMNHYYAIYKAAQDIKEPTLTTAALDKAAGFAEKAAPYLHPRLASTELKGNASQPVAVKIVHDIPRPPAKGKSGKPSGKPS